MLGYFADSKTEIGFLDSMRKICIQNQLPQQQAAPYVSEDLIVYQQNMGINEENVDTLVGKW